MLSLLTEVQLYRKSPRFYKMPINPCNTTCGVTEASDKSTFALIIALLYIVHTFVV